MNGRKSKPGAAMVQRIVMSSAALFGVVVAATMSCAPTPPKIIMVGPDGNEVDEPPAPALEEELKAAGLAQEAERLKAAGDIPSANTKTDELCEQYPGTAAGAAALELRAQTAADAADIPAAIQYYERLLFYRPSFVRADEAREHYAKLLLETGRYADAANMLQALYGAASNDGERLRLGLPLADAMSRAGRGMEALKVYIAVQPLTEAGSTLHQELESHALRTVASGISFSDAEDLWNDVQDDAQWASMHAPLAFKLAKIYFHTRDFARSARMLFLVTERYADSPYASQAYSLHEHLRARFRVDPKTIGVMLPLSGRFKKYGERALAAIKLALGKDSGLEIVIKDTKGSGTVASKAVEELVLEDHVLAIIGTLFSNAAMAAAIKAEELSVPLIALSHREGLPDVGPWVFRTGLTISAQAQALAKLAFDELGMTRFAILHPRSRYGVEFTEAFWDEVERRKGEVRGIESYEHDQTTFREQARRLVGRWYMYARHEYREKYEEIRKAELPPMRLKAEIERLEKQLPPVVDFDAIVIPDSGRTIGLIAPALAFEDVVMTRDPRILERIKKATGREEVNPITLLGASTWNSPHTVDSCERYCEDSVFVDAYYPASPEPRVRDFVAAFHEATESEPQLTEALAFDTAGLIRHVVLSSKPQDRQALLEILRRSTYTGVTGRFHFDETGETQKELFALTIKKRTIKLLERPEEPPKG